MVVVVNCFSILEFSGVFYLQSFDYCFKNWCRNQLEKGLAVVCCPVKIFCTKLLVRLLLCLWKQNRNIWTDSFKYLLLLTIFIVSFWRSVIISTFLFLFPVVKQPYLKPKASFVKTKAIGHFVCKNHQFKQRTIEAKTKESKCDRSVRVRTVSYLLDLKLTNQS